MIAGGPRTAREVAVDDFSRRRAQVEAIRRRARTMFTGGADGLEMAAALSRMTDEVVVGFADHAAQSIAPGDPESVPRDGAVIAVGGTGRGELSPCSDLDLLFLDNGGASAAFRDASAEIVQHCWDARLDLGHSIRTVSECAALARQDCEIATSLVEARLLWGSRELFDRLHAEFRKRVVDSRRRVFVEECIQARSLEFPEPGRPALELEPDVKRSLGGLRDLHLMRWVAFALFNTRDFDDLRDRGLLSNDEVRGLRNAWEFLTRIRFDLHFESGRPQDQLTREEQMRIADARGIACTAGQSSVERFMQEYFRHSSEMARVTSRFIRRHRPRSPFARARSALTAHRAEGILRVTRDELDAAPRHVGRLCGSLESVLRLYRSCAFYSVLPSPRLLEGIERFAPTYTDEISAESAELFMQILKATSHVGPILRSMDDVGVLELIVPDMRHARCLIQFNQYHHYTVDEHTLRAVEIAGRLATEQGHVGSVYRELKHPEILHLALLLHDLGKGFGESHSEVGRRIAHRIGARLRLSRHHRDQLVFLVHHHLEMSHCAFRRDIADERVLVNFCHSVGTPENLAMLFVLTAVDIRAVGPGAWTGWKDELLTELFDRSRVILGGRRDDYSIERRLQQVREDALESIDHDAPWRAWAGRTLDEFPASYLSCTPPERIREDLELIRRLNNDEVYTDGRSDPEAATLEYRVLTRNPAAADGCFHKMAGVLTAMRMEIVSAEISTTRDGLVIDSFKVIDRDFDGEAPPDRIHEVTAALRDGLQNPLAVEKLFRRYRRFGADREGGGVSDLPLRVELDNDSSESRTVIDVFAHDRPGLLFWIARAIYELNLSIELAKISTHYDQVVDVFYVREKDNGKVQGRSRLNEVRDTLLSRLETFERTAHREFVGQVE